MPSRAPRICQCGRVVAPGDICPCRARANAERKARFDLKRPSSSSRGYDGEWAKAAKAYLARSTNARCQCGRPSTLVAHILSIATQPELRMLEANWRPSCQRCNARDAVRDRRKQ